MPARAFQLSRSFTVLLLAVVAAWAVASCRTAPPPEPERARLTAPDEAVPAPERAEQPPAPPPVPGPKQQPGTTYRGEVYAPYGLAGATVHVNPVAEAEIRAVDGKQVFIGGRYDDPARIGLRRNYDRLRLPPGTHELVVGRHAEVRLVDPETGSSLVQVRTSAHVQSLQLDAVPGTYRLLLVWVLNGKAATRESERVWSPLLVDALPPHRVVSSTDPRLHGRPLDDARRFIAELMGQEGGTAVGGPE